MKIGDNVTIPEHALQGTPNFAAIVKSDTTVLANVRSVYVGAAGIVYASADGTTFVQFTCVAGTLLPISPVKIGASSTATLMVALY